MTPPDQDDDAQQLAELASELPTIDLDHTSAARIALRARQDVGKGPSPKRLVLPIVIAVTAVVYLCWMAAMLVDLLG
ncbi:MAG: hypothetical protein WKG01_28855 [Kofleriaceae bacterium]